jgi:hypothetical protein
VIITIIVILGTGYYILQDMGIITSQWNPLDLLSFLGLGPAGTQTPEFSVVELPPAWTPTVSSISDLDYSQWDIQLSDLPPEFETEPVDELSVPFDFIAELDDVTTVKQYTFSKEGDSPQLISGRTLLIPDQNSQTIFDEKSSTTEFIVEGVISTLEPVAILEQEEISGLEEIGEYSYGQSYVLDMEAVEMRVDIIAFRRDIAGVLLFTLYIDGYSTDVAIQDLASILDQRILTTLPSNP